MMEALREEGSAERMAARWRQVEQLAAIGAWELDIARDRTWWSSGQRAILGVSPETIASQALFVSLVHPADAELLAQAYADTLGRGHAETTYRIVRPDGEVRHMQGIATLERDAEGRAIRMFGTNQDVTSAVEATQARVLALAEKDALLREIQHRVNNNLAVVSSLLHFHAQRLESARDAETLLGLCRRIKAMALAHEQLQRASERGRIDMPAYLGDVVAQLRLGTPAPASVEVEVDPLALPLELAMPIGQVVSELLTNALVFGCSPPPGQVRVSLRWHDGIGEIRVEDAGPGFPPEFEPERAGGFGWLLIRMLTRQIGGRVELESRGGARVRIVVPWCEPDGELR